MCISVMFVYTHSFAESRYLDATISVIANQTHSHTYSFGGTKRNIDGAAAAAASTTTATMIINSIPKKGSFDRMRVCAYLVLHRYL